MLVLGYRSCVGDRYRNALRRSVEVLHLIRADPPPLLELQRLRRTLWQEWPKEGSDFVRVVWLARKALEMLGGSEGARLRELVKEFDLEDPPGAFYALRGKDEPVGRPLAGFFVNRLTGSVRHVSGKELWDAGMELGPLGLRLLVIPENRSDLQMVVRHLLTRRPGPRTRRSNAAPDDRSRGKWWQVWK